MMMYGAYQDHSLKWHSRHLRNHKSISFVSDALITFLSPPAMLWQTPQHTTSLSCNALCLWCSSIIQSWTFQPSRWTWIYDDASCPFPWSLAKLLPICPCILNIQIYSYLDTRDPFSIQVLPSPSCCRSSTHGPRLFGASILRGRCGLAPSQPTHLPALQCFDYVSLPSRICSTLRSQIFRKWPENFHHLAAVLEGFFFPWSPPPKPPETAPLSSPLTYHRKSWIIFFSLPQYTCSHTSFVLVHIPSGCDPYMSYILNHDFHSWYSVNIQCSLQLFPCCTSSSFPLFLKLLLHHTLLTPC